ncbi:MAG: response regulator [Deltaproteobacteria bacterium]|nr:MAG: response regulator [Deltaproteobacteria bacterium]
MNDVKKKVLLADDVTLFLELEKTFLKRADIDILVAHNGRQALELVRQHRPQLVFLDLYMPEMNGDECCRLIKDDADLAGVTVVMVTAAGNAGEIERCQAAGCNEVINKPINRSEFVQAANRYLQVETRRETRFATRIEILYGPSPQRQLGGFTLNLSMGGIYVETRHVLDVDENITLVFSLPGQEQAIRCLARVAWVNHAKDPKKPALPPGFGVQFVDISLDDLHAIRAYLTENDLQPAP